MHATAPSGAFASRSWCRSIPKVNVQPLPPNSPDAADVSAGAESPTRLRSGLTFALVSYVLWGFFPLYFLLLQPSQPAEIVAWRILFSLIFCAILLTATRSWPRLIAIIRQPRLLWLMALAGIMIVINWQVYIYATLNGHVIETSLGYFINPIVTVLLGVLVLHERLRPMQWVAVAVSAVAVIVLAANYGSFPMISLTLAFSFGLYGLIKKRVGSRVDALSGLTVETAWLVPVAVVQLLVVAGGAGITLGSVSVAHSILLVGTGIVTAVPLLLFAAGSRRLPLIYVGFTQFIAPILQLVIGIAVLGEHMPLARWGGFALVWFALIVLSVDLILAARRARASAS